jgi:hypothetical protein
MVKKYIKTKKRYKKTVKKRLTRNRLNRKRLTRKRLTRKRLTRKRLTKHKYRKKNKIKKGGRPSYTIKGKVNEEEYLQNIAEAAKKEERKLLRKKVGDVGKKTVVGLAKTGKAALIGAVPGGETAMSAYGNIMSQKEQSQEEVIIEIDQKLDRMDNKLNELLGRGNSGISASPKSDSEGSSE